MTPGNPFFQVESRAEHKIAPVEPKEENYFPIGKLQGARLILAGEMAALAVKAKIINLRVKSFIKVGEELSSIGMNGVGIKDKVAYRSLDVYFRTLDLIGNRRG